MKTTSTLNTIPKFTEERDFKFYNSPTPAKKFKTITLKGRLEFRKDYKAILYAASQTPGIVALQFNDFEVEITWLSEGTSTNGEKLDFWEDAQEHISQFLKLVKKAPARHCFSKLALETHVFWQSLKPINQYDGERDGFWAKQ